MKRLILIFCADGNAGKALAETLRDDITTTQLRDAETFNGVIEHCDNVVIMPDVSDRARERIYGTYDGFILELNTELDEPAKPKRGRPRKVAA